MTGPRARAGIAIEVPPTEDRRLQRRAVQKLTHAAVLGHLCSASTARLLRAHSTDASAVLDMLTGSALLQIEPTQKRKRRHPDLYEHIITVGEHQGVFARREKWGRIRMPDHITRHPDVRWGRGIFPDCRPNGSLYRSAGVPVTQSMLQKAAEMAAAVIFEEQRTIMLAFRLMAALSRGRPPEAVEMNTKHTAERLRGALLGMEEVCITSHHATHDTKRTRIRTSLQWILSHPESCRS